MFKTDSDRNLSFQSLISSDRREFNWFLLQTASDLIFWSHTTSVICLNKFCISNLNYICVLGNLTVTKLNSYDLTHQARYVLYSKPPSYQWLAFKEFVHKFWVQNSISHRQDVNGG
jgi:hypothetical protein